jgi:hypothetical protein
MKHLAGSGGGASPGEGDSLTARLGPTVLDDGSGFTDVIEP